MSKRSVRKLLFPVVAAILLPPWIMICLLILLPAVRVSDWAHITMWPTRPII
jgi:hypothetical protein